MAGAGGSLSGKVACPQGSYSCVGAAWTGAALGWGGCGAKKVCVGLSGSVGAGFGGARLKGVLAICETGGQLGDAVGAGGKSGCVCGANCGACSGAWGHALGCLFGGRMMSGSTELP